MKKTNKTTTTPVKLGADALKHVAGGTTDEELPDLVLTRKRPGRVK